MGLTYKLAVVGSGGVGKSALTIRFSQGIFVEKYDPTIEDVYRRYYEIDGNRCELEILDMAGTEQFQSMSDSIYKNAQGILMVYSIIAKSTYNDLCDLRENIVRSKGCTEFPMILVGNKSDLNDQRIISSSQGEEMASKFGCEFYETSAKDGTNADKIFHRLVFKINRFGEERKRVKGTHKKTCIIS